MIEIEVLRPAAADDHELVGEIAALVNHGRLGYRETGRLDLGDVEPTAVPFLTAPCEVAVMQKLLAAPTPV